MLRLLQSVIGNELMLKPHIPYPTNGFRMVLSGKGASGEKFSPLASKVFRERYHHLVRQALQNVMDLQGNVGDKIVLGTHRINTRNVLSFLQGKLGVLLTQMRKNFCWGMDINTLK